jgi:mono/diheme cytochrome c family protein
VTGVGTAAIAVRNSSVLGTLIWWWGCGPGAGKYDAAAVRPLLVTTAAIAAIGLSACGTEGIEVASDDPNNEGAVLFSERCSGCHTLAAAGAEGSANRALRNQGPNLDQRAVSADDALFAIRNGGFSGAIMPQNIVVGDEAEAVAEFVAEYSGTDVEE